MNPGGNHPNNNQQPNGNGNNNNNNNPNNHPNNQSPNNTYPNMPPNPNYNWSNPPPQQGQYPQQLPPNTQPGPPGQPVHPPVQNVQPVQPVMHDQYRLPPVFAPGYPQQPQMGGYPPAQPAPRQRTAIACRYCRRRKIRCSGFDQSEDGRCTNCVRFSQECIFTPVSAQTQAFVPAHALYRGQNAPSNQPLYGAYGQPLPPNANRDQQQYQPQQQQPGQYPPTPQGYQQPSMYPQQPPQGTPQMQEHDANGNVAKEAGRKNSTRDFGVQVNLPTPPKERDSRKDG